MATTWNERTRPATSWWQRVPPETSWDGRVRPETDRWIRMSPDTDRDWRMRPITYMTPLEDAYAKVADEDDRVIFVLADSGKLIPATFWRKDPLFNR